MSRVFATTSDHLDSASTIITDVPLTLSGWVKNTTLTQQTRLVTIGESGTGNNYYNVNMTSGFQVQVVERDATTSSTASSSARTPPGQISVWHLWTARFTSHSSRDTYLDGTSKASNGVARTASGVNSIRISGDTNATPAEPLIGNAAHVAIWNIALTDQQIASLLYLYPNQVAVGNLVHYWPLTNNQSPEPDYGSGNLPLTVTGTTFSTDNPNIAGTLVQQLMGAIG